MRIKIDSLLDNRPEDTTSYNRSEDTTSHNSEDTTSHNPEDAWVTDYSSLKPPRNRRPKKRRRPNRRPRISPPENTTPPHRSLEFYAPQTSSNSQLLAEFENDCRVCNNFKYNEDFERVHALEARRTARTRIRGTPEFYIIEIFTNHLLRDGKDVDDDDANGLLGGMKILDADRLLDCSYCKFLFDALNEFFKNGTVDWRKDARESSTLIVQVKVRPGHPLILSCATAFIVHHEFTLVRADLEVTIPDRGALTDSDFPSAELTVPEEDDSHKHRASEGFFRYWFRGCSGHRDATEQCYTTPNRLLYIDCDNDEVVLWERLSSPPGLPDVPDPIEYATLSHTWLNTDAEVPKLLTSNIDAWKEGQTISSLPAAIRDAIRVAHLNDIHFLFIDSMCIIQNSFEDQRVQGPMVSHYFRDSILTIVAASAVSPNDAFLHPPKKDWVTKQLPFVAPSGAQVTMTLRKKYSRPETPYDTLDKASHLIGVVPGSFRRTGPLYGRHWCLTEGLMGTRVIHFTSGGIMGQCRRHDCTRERVHKYNRGEWSQGMPERYEVRDASQLWLRAVEFHTSCKLLRGEDRLSKLSSLASTSDMGIQDRYVAGLWCNSMTMGLLWEVSLSPSQTNTNVTKITFSFDKQKAPSFSWASVDAPVVWRDNYWTCRDEARLVGCGSIPTDPDDPCGSVDGAWIRMEGIMFKCEVSQTLEGAGGRRFQYAYFRGKEDDLIKAYPFVGDGALATVQAAGAADRQRTRHVTKLTRRLIRKGYIKDRDVNPLHTRAFLTRNMSEFKPNVLGRKTTRAMAFILCIRQRGDYDEDRKGVVYDRWDGLVLTRSMRYPEAFERIGCIRGVSSTLLDFGEQLFRATIV
ncbi:hypothetical protein J3F84DRAFT_274325 [Trichoderma pleuroticola]